MENEKLIQIKGDLPAPAGHLNIVVKGPVLKFKREKIMLADILSICVGFAVPAKGGGYVQLYLKLKENKESTICMSEGYSDDLLAEYKKYGSLLAGNTGKTIIETPFGADA